MAEPLQYDVVMATRNRPDAVALSIPLIQAQTRAPRRIVIVDSSDDGAAIEEIALAAHAAGPAAVEYHHAAPGSARQRNIGLARCEADIVIFPDDDSLLYRRFAEALMAVYEADPDGRIAAVGGQPADIPPPESREKLGAYAAERRSTAQQALKTMRQRVKEASDVLNPFLSVGKRLNSAYARAPDAQTLPVPYVTGYRMSFRRSVIDRVRFDETLQRYSWFEDIDASWGAMASGGVVVARHARVFHHRVAGPRANGHRMGLWAILNRGYVVMKHVRANPDKFAAPEREVFRLRTYCRARALAYQVTAHDPYGRERARGARQGLRALTQLTDAPADRLSETYQALERALADGQ